MTMYVAVDLHDFVFFAADKRVTTRSDNGTSAYTDDASKLITTENGIVTGCGLEGVIQNVGQAMSGQGFTSDEKSRINSSFPTQLLNSTRVVIAPKMQPENERLLWLKFGEQQTDRFFECVGGLVEGAAQINDSHRSIVMQASAEYVRNKLQDGAFECLLQQITQAFVAVSQATDEVSSVFDFALQYPDGRQLINTNPV